MRIHDRSTTIRRTAATALAMVAASGVVAVGLTTTGATADPAGTQSPFGSSSLLQSEDFNDVAVKLDTETVALYGGQALSACTGEDGMYSITGGDTETGAVWKSLRNPDQHLTETTARAKNPNQATAFVKKLTDRLRTCQREHEPKGHWYYGKARTLRINGGSATWFMTYDGKGSSYPTGGVAVVRNGTQFGILELTAPSGDPVATVEQLTSAAIQRLA